MNQSILKTLRKEKGISIIELSNITGLSRNLISRTENGANTYFKNVVTIIEALGYELRVLIK